MIVEYTSAGIVNTKQLVLTVFLKFVEFLQFRVIYTEMLYKGRKGAAEISVLYRHSVGKETRGSEHEVSDATSSL